MLLTKNYEVAQRTSQELPCVHRNAGTVFIPTNVEKCKIPSYDEGKEIMTDGYSFSEYRINSADGLPTEAVQALLDTIK